MMNFLPSPWDPIAPLNLVWAALVLLCVLWWGGLLRYAARTRRPAVVLWLVPFLAPIAMLLVFPIISRPVHQLVISSLLVQYHHTLRAVVASTEVTSALVVAVGTAPRVLRAARGRLELRSWPVVLGAAASVASAVFSGLEALHWLLPGGFLAIALTLGTEDQGRRRMWWAWVVALCFAQAVANQHACRSASLLAWELQFGTPTWWRDILTITESGPTWLPSIAAVAEIAALPLFMAVVAAVRTSGLTVKRIELLVATSFLVVVYGLLALGSYSRLVGIPLGQLKNWLPSKVHDEGIHLPVCDWCAEDPDINKVYYFVSVGEDDIAVGRVATLSHVGAAAESLGSVNDADLGAMLDGMYGVAKKCELHGCSAAPYPLIAVSGDLPIGRLSGLASDLGVFGERASLLLLVHDRRVPYLVRIPLIGSDQDFPDGAFAVQDSLGTPVSDLVRLSGDHQVAWQLEHPLP